MKKYYILLLSFFILHGCGGGVGRVYTIEPIDQKVVFKSPIGEQLYADTGDEIFVAGVVGKSKAIVMSKGISSSIPGTFGVSFDFSIQESVLVQKFQTDKHVYYAAPPKKCSAIYSGKSVMAKEDYAGIRVDKKTGAKEWFVDNSVYNRVSPTVAIWHRKVKDEDDVTFTESDVEVFDKRSRVTKIIFDGYYNKLIHFTFIQLGDGVDVEKSFSFDIIKKVHPAKAYFAS